MDKTVHIISFNIPYPADYGGVIDVFYKVKALHELGVKIILHCFAYGRKEAKELEAYCEKVYYYSRNMQPAAFISSAPFIVQSRKNHELLVNLLKDDFPILFEGLHTCAFLNNPELIKRNKIVRLHNVEHLYYSHLASLENNFLKQYYLKNEAKKLLGFERNLTAANHLIAISENDHKYYSELFNKVQYLPAFHGNATVKSKAGNGNYFLFHADLSVSENSSVAIQLTQILSEKALVIAGKNPSDKLRKACFKNKITLIPNPDFAQMEQLIMDAQATIVYAIKSSGMKLKLLNSLYLGRFCIANIEAIASNDLEKSCIIIRSLEELASLYHKLVKSDFTQSNIQAREEILNTRFNDAMNAAKIWELI